MGNRVEKGALGGVRCRIDCLMRFLTIYPFPIILLCDVFPNGAMCNMISKKQYQNVTTKITIILSSPLVTLQLKKNAHSIVYFYK